MNKIAILVAFYLSTKFPASLLSQWPLSFLETNLLFETSSYQPIRNLLNPQYYI